MPKEFKKDEITPLHRKAEAKVNRKVIDTSLLTREEAVRLLSELEVRQIELERQNNELKMSCEEQTKARDFYLDLYEHAPVGYLSLTKHNTITRANITACQMLGMNRADLLRKKFTEFIAPESRDEFHPHRRAVLRTLTKRTCKIILRRPDGNSFWANIDWVHDREGMRITFTDTGRIEAEEALRESEERFRTVANSSPWMIWVTDASGDIQFVNKAYKDFFGVSLEHLQRYGWQSQIHPDDRDTYVGSFTKSLNSRTPFHCQARVRHADGQWHWIESFGMPRYFSKGEFLGMVGSSPDITSRKVFEEELERYREHLEEQVKERTTELAKQIQRLKDTEGNFEMLIHSIPDAILILDKDDRIVFSNPASYTLFKSAGRKLTGKVFGYPALTEMAEIEVPSEDDKTKTLEMRMVKLNRQGLAYKLIIMRDITAHKEDEQSIRSLSQRMIEIQENERREIGHALHDEIGGSITMLKLALGRVKSRHDKNAMDAMEQLDKIVDEVAAQVRHISHSMRPSVLDDFGLVEALKWYTNSFRERSAIRVTFIPGSLNVKLPGYVESALYRIVQEALTNAAKHSGARTVDIRLSTRQGVLKLSIKDDGQGFNPDKISKGLGVMGMKDLAELAGGSLVINSSAGRGTHIQFTLPAVSPKKSKIRRHQNNARDKNNHS